MKILNQHKISRAPNTEFIEFLCVPKISDWPVNSDIIMVRHGEAFFEVGGWYVIISAPYSPSVRAFRKSGSSGVGWGDLYDPSDPNGVNWVWAHTVGATSCCNETTSKLPIATDKSYQISELRCKIQSPWIDIWSWGKNSFGYYCPASVQRFKGVLVPLNKPIQ